MSTRGQRRRFQDFSFVTRIVVVVARHQPKIADTDEGHAERLRRTQERSHAVLSSDLAQSPGAPMLGMQLTMNLMVHLATGSSHVVDLRHELPDRSSLELAAVKARPFTLQREAIYGPYVADSLLRFAMLEEQQRAAEQLKRLWGDQPFKRMQFFSQTTDGTPLLPEAGVWNSEVGDRVLYSQLVHADDASELLNQINDDHQLWSLASVVGDWLAIIAHQQMILHWVRPDLCSQPTSWAGSPTTVFERLGVKLVESSSEG